MKSKIQKAQAPARKLDPGMDPTPEQRHVYEVMTYSKRLGPKRTQNVKSAPRR